MENESLEDIKELSFAEAFEKAMAARNKIESKPKQIIPQVKDYIIGVYNNNGNIDVFCTTPKGGIRKDAIVYGVFKNLSIEEKQNLESKFLASFNADTYEIDFADVIVKPVKSSAKVSKSNNSRDSDITIHKINAITKNRNSDNTLTALHEDIVEGDLICFIDGSGKNHFAIVLYDNGNDYGLLFKTTNNLWNSNCRKITKEERMLIGFPDRGREEYFAPVLRDKDCCTKTDKSFSNSRVEDLKKEFPIDKFLK